MNELLQIERQKGVEYTFSKANIKKRIQAERDASPVVLEKMNHAAQLLAEWVVKDHGYEAKNKRLAPLMGINFYPIVEAMADTVLPIDRPTQFTSVVGMLAGKVPLDDQKAAVTTVAELLAVTRHAGMWDIEKHPVTGILHIKSRYKLSKECLEFIEKTKYLPPMVCQPAILKNNNQTGYLTQGGSTILGKNTHHEEDICLEHLNKLNAIPFCLNTDLLNMYAEMPEKVLNTREKREAYDKMRKDSLRVYVDLVAQGNKFHITNRPDMRGRTYAQGYHVSTQGSAYKKAIVDLYNKEVITGEL